MHNDFFVDLEACAAGATVDANTVFDHLAFNQDGLIPVITQDHESLEVLMMAWMNRDALERTLELGQMVYWSRSRSSFWHKGATSGHFQILRELRVDCDGDTLLCRVEQQGAACHAGRPSCFYFRYDNGAQSAPAHFIVTQSPPAHS